MGSEMCIRDRPARRRNVAALSGPAKDVDAIAPRVMPTPATVARPAIDSTSRLPIVTASRLRVEALRELQPAAADARDAARCLTACYVSNHGPETALAKPFISDSELCCVAGGGIVIARCSVQCAVYSAQRRARTGRLAARRCSC